MIPRARRFSPTSAPHLRRTSQNRTDAAAELVRLEYERERLLNEVKDLLERVRRAEVRRDGVESRVRSLHELLGIAPREGEVQPATLTLQINGSTLSVQPTASTAKVPHAHDRNRRKGA
jgi:uncharacterized protein YlxW (UPF0749 family)